MNYLVDCKACHKNLPKQKPPQRCLAPSWWFWRLCWLGEVGAVGLDDLLVPEEAVLAAAGKRAVAVVVLVNVDEAVALLSSRRSRRSPNRCSPTWRSPSGPCRPRWQAPSIDCKRFIALRCVHGTTQPAFYNRRTRGLLRGSPAQRNPQSQTRRFRLGLGGGRCDTAVGMAPRDRATTLP